MSESVTIEKKTLDYQPKDPQELTYVERHIVKHLRHVRDKEYTRLAWKYCKDYSEVFTKCDAEAGFFSPFKCQDPLDDLKICINRQMIRMREAAPEITTVPPEIEIPDWDAVGNYGAGIETKK